MNNGQYLKEVQKALEHDTKRIGDVWRLTKEGKRPDKIAEELNVSTSNFVYGYQKFIQAIEERDLPKSSTMARDCGAALRGFIKRHHENFSKETRQELERRAEECDRLATDPQVLEEEDAKVKKEMSEAELTPGIYVYTYPHYHHHPVVPKTDDTDARTYLKVGMSEKDAFKRVMQQKTGIPETPMLLQIWEVENGCDRREIEKKIHDHLRTIGHGGPPRKEWFLTNAQSVASTADLLGLKPRFKLNLETDG